MSRRYFLSFVRQGASAGILTPDPLRGPIAKPPEIAPKLFLRRDGKQLKAIEGPRIRVMDPGDVQGISELVITRRYPEVGSITGAPNDLAYIEFSQPDLPWMFTPASGTPEQRLRPWIVLVVVPLSTELGTEQPVPRLKVVSSELPALDDSSAWAHAQVMAESEADIGAAIERGGSGAVSRLVCPRKLEADTAYIACVVPTFNSALEPSWSVEDPGRVEVPVYISWTFRTGRKEDFEELVTRLKPINSTGVGTRKVDASRPWPTFKSLRELAGNIGDTSPAIFEQDGALAVPGQETRPSLDDACRNAFQSRLAEQLNHPSESDKPQVPLTEDPDQGASLAPPIYGGRHANVDEVRVESRGWVDVLNLDPKRRAAAAMGTRYVQEHQEFLMARAWEQLQDIEKANQLRRVTELASAASDALHRRSVASLTASEILGLAAPARTRIRLGEETLQAEVHASTLPDAVATPTFTRLLRNKGPVARRMLSAGPSMLVERALKGEDRVLPPLATATAPVVSTEREFHSGPGGFDVTSRQAAAYRTLVAATEEQGLAQGLAAALQAVEEAETASLGGMTFPAALQPARDKIRGELAAFDLRPGQVSGLRTLFDDPAKVQIATDVIGVVAAFVAKREMQTAVRPPRSEQSVDPDSLRDGLINSLSPSRYLSRRMKDRVELPFPESSDSFGAIMTHPEFPAPLAMALLQKWPDVILPGIASFPMNKVALLGTNPEFIEAFMVGVNHEMNREFLWREFPTDQRGTPFKHFWPRPAEGGSDGREIDPIVGWPVTRPLGSNLATTGAAETVLLVRGEVLRRFPNTIVMAAPALDNSGTVGPPPWRLPKFPIPLGNDSMAYMFDLTPEIMLGSLGSPGWFFVFAEPISVPRFGFDVSRTRNLDSWNDMAWTDVTLSRERFLNTNDKPTSQPLSTRNAIWGATAADMATITLQRPFRLLFHAKALLHV